MGAGIPLTPRLSNALFGDAPLEEVEQGATQASPPRPSDGAPGVAAIAQLDEWVQHSDGYEDDDDFFDFVSGFPEDEARTVQYSKLLAEAGNRFMPELDVSSDTSVPVSEDKAKQDAAKAAFQATMEAFRAAASRKSSSRSHIASHAHHHDSNTVLSVPAPSAPSLPADHQEFMYTYLPDKDIRANASITGKTCKVCKGARNTLTLHQHSPGRPPLVLQVALTSALCKPQAARLTSRSGARQWAKSTTKHRTRFSSHPLGAHPPGSSGLNTSAPLPCTGS